jgi:histidyl-tRNA synthetase
MTLKPEHLGRFDILAEQQRFFTFFKKIFRHEFPKNGFTRLTTSVFDTEEASRAAYIDDIVMGAAFAEDRAEHGYVLKSHGYLTMLRAYQAHLRDEPQPVYHYTLEPQFRYLANNRGIDQYWALNAYAVGEADPILDATLVSVYSIILDDVGLAGRYRIVLNSRGNAKEQERFLQELVAFFDNKKHLMTPEEKSRFAADPLSVFSFGNPDIAELLSVAPKIRDFIKKDSKEYLADMREYLDILEVETVADDSYYGEMPFFSGPVWKMEIRCDAEDGTSSWKTVGSGGRFDDLARRIGESKPIPAVGCELDSDALLAELMKLGTRLRNKDAIQLYLIQLGDEAKKLAVGLNRNAQKRGINSLLSLGTPSLKTQMKKATDLNTRFVAVIGIMEAKNKVCQLKDLLHGTQEEASLASLVDLLAERLGEENLDFFHPLDDLVIEDRPKLQA